MRNRNSLLTLMVSGLLLAGPALADSNTTPISSDEFNERHLSLDRQLDLLKIEAEIAETRKRISEATPSKISDENLPRVSPSRSGPNSAAGEGSDVQHIGKRIEDLYVTRIEGFGSNLTATVYNQNHVMQIRRGEEVLPGIVVKDITPASVLFQQDKKTVRVPLTTAEIAHRNTIKRGEVEAPRRTDASVDPFMSSPSFPFPLQ